MERHIYAASTEGISRWSYRYAACIHCRVWVFGKCLLLNVICLVMEGVHWRVFGKKSKVIGF